MELKDYQSQIRTLIPLRKEADFNDLLNKILFGESASDKFLIKMELNRLAQPCIRIIDLRDKVTEETSPYKHEKLQHHLTQTGITALNNALKLFDEYTVGVYEMVLAQVQEAKQAQLKKVNVKTVENSNLTESIQLNNRNKRAAPRMFFVSPITVTLDDGEVVKATTSNISTSGLKIKLAKQVRYQNNKQLQILFTGLASKYKDEQIIQEQVDYRLVKQEQDGDAFYFYLNIDNHNAAFIRFTQSFIRTNQYKYKMDVHYYFELARENALKNSALRSMNTLPVYLDINNVTPIVFMLKNPKNKHVLTDWECQQTSQLPFLFSELRLLRLVQFAKIKATTTLYTFTYINNDIEYLLSATEEELNSDDIKQLFIEYGQSKSNFRCYQLTLKDFTYESSVKHELTALQPKSFKQVTHLATLTELTTQEVQISFPKHEEQSLKKLNNFVHRVSKNEVPIVFNLFPDEHRKEERYKFSSEIQLQQGTSRYTGKIIDFSLSGLKIKLDKVTVLAKNSLVKVDFTHLQTLSKQFSLVGLEYRAISPGGKRIYHLQIASTESFKITRQFFPLLLKSNPSHFDIVPLTEKKQPAMARLHEIAESSLDQALFFVTTGNGKPKISFSSIPPTADSLKTLFGLECNIYKQHNHIAISNNQLLDRLLYAPLRTTTTEPLNFEQTVYVRKMQNKKQKWSITSYLDEDFASDEAKRDFIIEQKKRGQLQILHYRLTTIKKPDLNTIQSEMNIISRFAMHLTKRVETELLSVTAMIEIIDRTDYILIG